MRAPSPRLLWISLLCAVPAGAAGAVAAQGPEAAACAVCAEADSLVAAGDTAAALILLRSHVAETSDPHAGGELGLLLARRVSMLRADSANRAEAKALLARALAADPARSRWALGYGLILWKEGREAEALEWTRAALRAAGPQNGGLEPELLAELHAARGSIFEQRVIDRESLTSATSLTVDTRACPTGQCVVDVVDASLERLMQAPVDDAGSGEAREAMQHHLAIAFSLDPLLETSTYALLAGFARAGEWDMVVALAREYVDASGGAGWPLAFLGAGLWRSGDGAAAEAVPSVTPRTPDWFEVRLDNARNGVHRITLTIIDLVSGGTAGAQRSFAVGSLADCEILPGTP